MGTTASKLQRILQSKSAIKQAIINKGGSVGDKMSDYASAIESIETGGSGGIIPTGTIKYDKNGLYNVSAYEMADINVKGEPYEMTQAQMDTFLGSPKCQSGDIVLNTDTNEYYKITGGQGEEYGYEKLSESTGSGSSGTGSGGDGEVRSLKKLLDYTKSCYYMFYKNKDITDLTGYFEYSDTENVTNMERMFEQCSKLTTSPKINTANVTIAKNMFSDCGLLKDAEYDLSNANDVSSMFYNCSSVTSLNITISDKTKNLSSFVIFCQKLTSLSPLITDAVNSFSSAFQNCLLLEKIDLSAFHNMSQTYQNNAVFANCHSLKKLIIRKMDSIPALSSNAFEKCYHLSGTVNETYNPEGLKDGYIYVPDNMVTTLKTYANWSVYADQIKGLSELVED